MPLKLNVDAQCVAIRPPTHARHGCRLDPGARKRVIFCTVPPTGALGIDGASAFTRDGLQVQDILAGSARRALYASSQKKFATALAGKLRRIPRNDRERHFEVIAATTAKHSASLNPPAHPESDWFHPLADRVHALWMDVRDRVTPVRSTPAIRYFTATVVHLLGQPEGMVVGTTTVLAPHAG